MAPKFAPYRLSGKRGKNDAADAAAIFEEWSLAEQFDSGPVGAFAALHNKAD
jgi:hypothetical protein